MAAGMIVTLFAQASMSGWPRQVPLIIIFPIVYGAASGLLDRQESRLRRRAAAAQWRLCSDCMYTLAGESGVCRECGRAYTEEGLKKEWSAR